MFIAALVRSQSLIWRLCSLIWAPAFSVIMQSHLKDFCFITTCYLHVERLSVTFSCVPVRVMENEEGRKEYLVFPPSKSQCPASSQKGRKIPLKGNGRRIDYILYSDDGLQQDWKLVRFSGAITVFTILFLCSRPAAPNFIVLWHCCSWAALHISGQTPVLGLENQIREFI